ncbi:unnamed protein product [Amoebophrya sp. A120]|nr:unnamed protein product [Amoebophrya sp. A120]|eukprot:GSA120T00011905001.1
MLKKATIVATAIPLGGSGKEFVFGAKKKKPTTTHFWSGKETTGFLEKTAFRAGLVQHEANPCVQSCVKTFDGETISTMDEFGPMNDCNTCCQDNQVCLWCGIPPGLAPAGEPATCSSPAMAAQNKCYYSKCAGMNGIGDDLPQCADTCAKNFSA